MGMGQAIDQSATGRAGSALLDMWGAAVCTADLDQWRLGGARRCSRPRQRKVH